MWKYILIFVAATTLFACKEKEEPPYIFFPLQSGQDFRSGKYIPLKATITDDHGLVQLNVSAHTLDSFLREDVFQNITSPFKYSEQISISGITYFFSDSVFIADSAASGDYYFTFSASDEDGFITNSYLYLSIQNRLDTIAPEILDTINDTTIVGNIPVDITFNDDQELSAAELIFRRKDSTTILYYLALPLSGASLQTNQQIPVTTEGIYNLEIITRDWVNNVATKTKKIVIIN